MRRMRLSDDWYGDSCSRFGIDITFRSIRRAQVFSAVRQEVGDRRQWMRVEFVGYIRRPSCRNHAEVLILKDDLIDAGIGQICRLGAPGQRNRRAHTE